MKDRAEEIVRKFYDSVGWCMVADTTEDAKRWEDLREHAKKYVSRCRLRVIRHIPEKGENLLDMGSGPIQYKEYLEYSRNFQKRYCIDLSLRALEDAKKKIGDHGVFLHGSFFDIHLEENFFDCAVSLHTIYHIDKDRQEAAVRKLIHVTKPGKPVIIVYSNPNTMLSSLRSSFPFRLLSRIKRSLHRVQSKRKKEEKAALYFFEHPIEWWDRFDDVADVKIVPWRSFNSNDQKILIPDNKLGEKMFDIIFNLEEHFASFFVKHFQYYMIILIRRKS